MQDDTNACEYITMITLQNNIKYEILLSVILYKMICNMQDVISRIYFYSYII